MAVMKITCFRISNHALAGDTLPERIKVLGWGDNITHKGKAVKVTPRTLAVLSAAQAERGFDRVALDYEHNTVKGTPEFERTSEPRKVAGYGSVEVVEGEGLFIGGVTYTPSGADNAREYYDLSPAVELDETTGEVLFVHSVALCRHGQVDGLHFFNVEIGGDATTNKGDSMDEQIKALQEQVASMQQALTDLSAKLEAMSKKTPDTEQKVEAMSAEAQKIPALEQRIEALSADMKADAVKRDKDSLLMQARYEGKVIALSAEAVASLSVKDLADHVTKIQPTVPMQRITPLSVDDPAKQQADSNLAQIARNCGVDPEKVKKN